MPAEVKEHDKALDREMYASVSNPQADPLVGAAGGMGGMWGAAGLGRAAGLGGLGGLGGTDPLGGLGGGAEGDGAPSGKPVELPKRNWE